MSKKQFEINGIVEIEGSTLNDEQMANKLIEWVTAQGGTFTGSVIDINETTYLNTEE